MKKIDKLLHLMPILLIVVGVVSAISLSAFAAEGTYLRGDADGNGVVNINDCTTIQKVLAEAQPDADGNIALRGDVTGDGLNISDVTAIQKYLANMENIYHIGEEVSYPQPTTEGSTTKMILPTSLYELPVVY